MNNQLFLLLGKLKFRLDTSNHLHSNNEKPVEAEKPKAAERKKHPSCEKPEKHYKRLTKNRYRYHDLAAVFCDLLSVRLCFILLFFWRTITYLRCFGNGPVLARSFISGVSAKMAARILGISNMKGGGSLCEGCLVGYKVLIKSDLDN